MIKEFNGIDPKYAEGLFFSKTFSKCDKLNDLQDLSKIKIQKSKPEKAFNDIIFKLNGNSLTKHSLESNFIEKENRFYKKRLGKYFVLTSDSILFQLSQFKTQNEEIIRKIHSENYIVLLKFNSRVNKMNKIKHLIQDVEVKLKREIKRKNRFLEIIEVCQKNQNLNGFFVEVIVHSN